MCKTVDWPCQMHAQHVTQYSTDVPGYQQALLHHVMCGECRYDKGTQRHQPPVISVYKNRPHKILTTPEHWLIYLFWNITTSSCSKSDMSMPLPLIFTSGCLRNISQPMCAKKKPLEMHCYLTCCYHRTEWQNIPRVWMWIGIGFGMLVVEASFSMKIYKNKFITFTQMLQYLSVCFSFVSYRWSRAHS